MKERGDRAEASKGGDARDQTTPAGVGLDAAAIEASIAASVRAAQWLLGTAGALVPVVVAGVQLTRLGDAVGRPGAFAVSMIALILAAIAISCVLVVATRVLRVPYADLSDVSGLRRRWLTPRGWKKDFAREQWERSQLAISAATGGKFGDIPSLHDKLQDLRASDDPKVRADAEKFAEVARVAVAIANHIEIERRFKQLQNTYIAAFVVVLAAVTMFVAATAAPAGGTPITEPVTVRVFPANRTWPPSLGNCSANELLGAAVSGSWPTPTVAVFGEEGCTATIIEDATGIIAVPVTDDRLLPSPSPAGV